MRKRIGHLFPAALAAALLTGCVTVRRAAPEAAFPAATPSAEPAAAGRMRIGRAQLSLEASRVSDAVARIEEAARQAGGHVESKSDADGTGAYLVLRIPAPALAAAMTALESAGRVLHREISFEDVTEQYVDTEARRNTLAALRDRLRTLLDKAQNVQDILAIEKELGRIQADLDALQARLTSLQGQVELATVQVQVRRTRILGPLGYLLKGAGWVVGKLFVIRS